MKKLILTIAFALPVAIFLFLKLFGRNEFAVEPLFQNDVITVDGECGEAYKAPYVVAQTVLSDIKWKETDSLTLYSLDPAFDKVIIDFKRLSEKYTPEELRLWYLAADTLHQGENIQVKDVVTNDQLKHCFFLLTGEMNAVVIDSKRRIRGQYNLTERKEFDRLEVETKIILKK
jgi:hypothetical protein